MTGQEEKTLGIEDEWSNKDSYYPFWTTKTADGCPKEMGPDTWPITQHIMHIHYDISLIFKALNRVRYWGITLCLEPCRYLPHTTMFKVFKLLLSLLSSSSLLQVVDSPPPSGICQLGFLPLHPLIFGNEVAEQGTNRGKKWAHF